MRFLKPSNSLLVKGPAKVLGCYLLFSIIWIVTTDLLSEYLAQQHGTYLQTVKGIIYVCLSGGILCWLTRSLVAETGRLEETVAEIFDQSKFGVFILDDAGRILDCNERCAAMLGYKPAEIIGSMEPRFIPENKNLTTAQNGDEDSVNRYLHKDGHYVSARVAASRAHLSSGETFVVGLVHNATDEVNAHRVIQQQENEITAMSVAVRRSEARSKLLMETDLVGVFVATTDGHVADGNDYFLNMLGLTRQELKDGKVSWSSSTAKEYEAIDLNAADELRTTHRVTPYEKEFITKYGERIPVLISANYLSENPSGVIEALVSVIDLRDIKRAEAELARLALAVESAYEGIAVTDADFKIFYCNPAFESLTGYTRAELLDRSLTEVLQDGEEVNSGKALWKTIDSGGTWRGRILQQKKNGSEYLEDVTVTPVRDRNGEITNYLTIRKDISREYALEQQLIQAQKMEAVGHLSGGIAHDLNNVLQVVHSSAELARRRTTEPDYVVKKLTDVLNASERGAAIIAQLLAFTRKNSETPKLTNLNEVASDTVRLLHRLLPAHIEVQTEFSPEFPRIHADSVQLSQVILNLCVNARDAMPDGGVLRVRTSTEEDATVRLSVEDNGTGMEERVKQKIFEPFFTTKPAGKGTGLGLSTVLEIVQRAGGKVSVESEMGKGTRFDLFFPRAGDDPEIERADHPQDRGSALHIQARVLVCEDDGSVRAAICECLEDVGWTVIACANAAEARAVASQQLPSILVTDVMLPGDSGVQLTKELRITNEKLKVLLITGHTESEILKTVVSDASTMFLQKPFSAASLVEKIRELQRSSAVS